MFVQYIVCYTQDVCILSRNRPGSSVGLSSRSLGPWRSLNDGIVLVTVIKSYNYFVLYCVKAVWFLVLNNFKLQHQNCHLRKIC